MRRLRALRQRQFLTQKAVADKVGVPLFTVQRWEAGAFPRLPYLRKLCEVLGLSPDELVEPDEWPQPQPRAPKAAA